MEKSTTPPLVPREAASEAGLPGSRKQAMPTIDTLKGFSMIMVFHVHFAWPWRASDWFSLLRLFWYFTDFFGVATFLIISLVGSMRSIQARWASGNTPLYTREKLLRISYLLLCGEVMNLFFLQWEGPFHLLIWNVLTGIAVFSLLLPLVMKLPVWLRLAMVIALVSLYYPLLDWSMGPMRQAGLAPDEIRLANLLDPRTLVYFTLFCHTMMMPPYPWLIALLLTTVLFRTISSPSAQASPALFSRELKRILVYGIALIGMGISSGFWLARDYDASTFQELLVPGQYLTWPFPDGIFVFLIGDVPQSIFFNVGIVLVLFSTIGYFQIIKGKRFIRQELVDNVGRSSLTAYILTHVAMCIPVSFSMPAFYVIFVPMLIAYVGGLWIWKTRYRGVGSLEYAMDAHVHYITILIDKQRTKHRH
nr:hypothetical protein [Candidatus Sigynarchaeum springense]